MSASINEWATSMGSLSKMRRNSPMEQFLLCLKNKGYAASLEVRKVDRVLSDPVAATRDFVRVIDESGEDYLYPADFVVAVDLPQSAMSAFASAS